jgi:hypothetical protein
LAQRGITGQIRIEGLRLHVAHGSEPRYRLRRGKAPYSSIVQARRPRLGIEGAGAVGRGSSDEGAANGDEGVSIWALSSRHGRFRRYIAN